jgi:uracil-DNA glycosylase family 4
MQIDLFDAELNQILSAGTYAEFSGLLSNYNCKRCTLCYSRTKIVIDRGSPQADILAISERPGNNEDLIGKAFTGRAGELLDKMFEAIGLDSNQHLLITNVVKCKPEVDRSPSKDEVEACFPFLEKQIKLVKPKVVVLLGAVALKWVDPSRTDIKMEEEAGRFFELPRFPGVQFMVMYNPAFLLRDPRKKTDAWEHLKNLQAYLKKQEIV